MVLDGAKGIEPQTRKLYEVCRTRRIPIITFVNKMDHDALDPLELVDHVERVLGIAAAPRTWPIGDGPQFKGVYDLDGSRVLRFERTAGGRQRAPVVEGTLADPDGELEHAIGRSALDRLREGVAIVTEAGHLFDRRAFLEGGITPVFFGSALNNFGIETLLQTVAQIAPPPGPRETTTGRVEPTAEAFSGFVFKMQANMDPRHRDCMAFVRVCSGRFERDMVAYHPRTGRRMRLGGAQRLFGRDRETVDEAYPGDVIGVVNAGDLGIGDTLTVDPAIEYAPIPRFEPECFARLRNRDLMRTKQFTRGLAQLEQEGVVQVLREPGGTASAPVLAAVGVLQFDVVKRRLLDEYGVATALDPLTHTDARLVGAAAADVRWPSDALRLLDRERRPVVLFRSSYDASYFEDRHPEAGLRRFATGVRARDEAGAAREK